MRHKSEEFNSIAPRSSKLQGLIAYYYFHETHDPKGLYQVIYYPHYHNAINIYRNAVVTLTDKGREIKATKKAGLHSYYTANLQSSRVVKMYGMNQKIGIVLQPLGINHFFSGCISQVKRGVVTPFELFGSPFHNIAESLYQQTSIQLKRDILDQFFLSQFIGFKDHAFHSMIQQLMIEDPSMSLTMMADILGISEKTVYRKFIRYFGHSPSDFKAVVRFRLALNNYQQQKKSKPNLTTVGLNSAYYDQSDFIKHYKSLVGLTPKQLFKRIQVLGENNTIWTYI